MPEFQGTLLFDSAINLQGLTQGAQRAKAVLDRLGTDAAKTFQNDIGRALGNAVRPENFAADVARSKALLKSIGVETSKSFETALGRKQAKALLQPFIDETKSLSGQLKGILASNFNPQNFILGTVGGFGLATLGTELVRFGKDSVAFASNFETSLTKIKTISDRGTNIEKIGDELETLSTRIPQDLLTLSEGLFNIIGSGINDSAEALKVLDVAARAATAGFTDTKFAADAIVFAINAFGKSTDDAEEIANVLFKTVDVGKIEFSQLATNIGEVANPAAIAGVSLQELGQAIATITLGGTPVAETFTSLKNLLQSIIAPTEGARKAAEALGLDFSKAGIAAAGGLENFLQKVRGVTGGDTQKLDKLFPEARALRAAQILTNTLADTYVRLGDEFANTSKKSGEMQKAFEDVNDSATAQATIFTNNLKLATLELGKSFLEVLKPALKAVNQGFIENEKAVGNYVKSVIGFTKLLGNPQLAAILGFGSFFKGAQPKSNIPVLDEVEVVAERVQAVSDNVQTLSSAAEDTAKNFERAAKAAKEIEVALEPGGNFVAFKRSFQAQIDAKFNTPKLEIDDAAFNTFKNSFQSQLKKMFKGEFPPTEDDIRKMQERRQQFQQDFIGLADLFDRNLGNIFDSLFNFANKIADPNGAILGKFVAGSNFFITAFTQAQSIVESAFKALFGESNLRQRVQERVDAANAAREAEEQQARDFIQALKDVEEALKGPETTAGNLIDTLNSLTADITEMSGLTGKQIQTVLDALKGQNFKPATTLQEFIDQLTFLSYQKPELLPIIDLLNSIKDPNLKQVLTTLFGQLPGVLDAISKFGNNIGQQFDELVKNLNTRFDLLNIDDPLKKLDLLAKGIRDKFKAIVPTTDAGIRDLIAKGLEALEAGGQTLVNFLKGLDLEELTADQFRDFLQLLNQLANEAKSKVEDIGKATDEEITIAAVRQITYTQGNKLIDELTTMRIIQTQMLDIMRGASLRVPDFKNFGIPGNRIVVVNNTGVTEGSEADLRGLNRRQLELAMAASRAQGVN